jgi:hypothetical protein
METMEPQLKLQEADEEIIQEVEDDVPAGQFSSNG